MMNTKRSLITSLISLLLCFAMLLGTTFAWFTDAVTSSGNKIEAGSLKLDLLVLGEDDGQWRSIKDNHDPIFNYRKWEPGYTEVKILKVVNLGTLSLKWQARFVSENELSKLAEVIDVYVCPGVAEAYPTGRDLDSTWKRVGTLDEFVNTLSDTTYGFLDKDESATLGIALKMQESAGNEYKNLTLGEFDIRIVATQATAEEDSFDNKYDEGAKWPDPINFKTSANLSQTQIVHGELASDFIIRYSNSIYALLPAGVKLANGATRIEFSGKPAENDSNLTLGEGDSAKSYDIHIEGIAEDNTKPITVYLGAALAKNISDTSLKLYHENALMTRVDSVADFAINNQYTYDPETGEVVLYVDNFSVFSAVETSADKWDGTSDTSWYNENDTEFTLASAEQLAGFRDLVDGGNTFAGKTVKLGTDIDLTRIPFDPIGFGYYSESKVDANGTDTNTVFMGTFDGGNHTIYNLYENCWELDPDKTNYSTYTYSTAGAGLFASIKDATIKNLAISGAEIVFECVDMGIVVGYAQGTCHFENIVVTDSNIANYNRYTGGVVGEVSYGPYGIDTSLGYSHTFKNVTVDSTVKVSGLWGSFGCGMGGVIGGKWGDATVKMENVISAPEMDVYNDVVSAYQWYAFRGCGMLIGHTEEPYSDGRHSGNATASFLTCENVKVYYGDWVNYHYYEFENQDNATGQRYPWVRAEAGEYCDAFSNIRYGVPTHNGVKVSDLTEEELKAVATDYTPIVFDQLYGADRGMYGTAEHPGVTVFKTNVKTVYIHNNASWTNLKLDYWYKHGEETWTNLLESVALTPIEGETDIYKLEIPHYADSFKVTADSDNSKEFVVSDVANNGFYALVGEHVHEFDENSDCICGCKKVTVNIAEYAAANGWVNATKYSSIVANDDIAIACTGGSNTGKLYGNNNWRIYQSDAGKVIITSTKGNIIYVKITYEADNTGTLILNGTNIASEDVVDVNDVSVTFGVGNTGSVTNGIARITNIEVVYSTALACAHKRTATESKEPTCTAAGYIAEKCIDCGTVLDWQENDPATGHSYSGKITKEATCTEKGLKTYTCERCQSSYQENISEKGHSYTEEVTKEATCTTAGDKTLACSACGDIKTEIIDALGHNYVDGVCSVCDEKEPSGTSNRYYIATIRTSGNYFYMTSDLGTANTKRYQAVDSGLTTLPASIATPESGYVFVLIDNGDGTYSIQAEGVEGNNYLGWTSGNSGALVNKESALKLTVDITDGIYNIHFADSDGERYLALNGTSGNNYFAWYKSGQKQDLILIPVESSEPETPACEHTNTTETTTATCTEAGTTTVTCDACGETVSTEETAALGHTTENGTCGRCGEEIGGEEGGGTPAEEVTLSKTAAEIMGLAGLSTANGTSVNNKEIALDGNVSIICSQAGSGTPPSYYSPAIRLYQNGATLTVKGTGMKTIIITVNSTSGDGPISVSGGTASALTSMQYTITVNEGVEEVVITTTGTDKNSRVYVSNIEVTYEK